MTNRLRFNLADAEFFTFDSDTEGWYKLLCRESKMNPGKDKKSDPVWHSVYEVVDSGNEAIDGTRLFLNQGTGQQSLPFLKRNLEAVLDVKFESDPDIDVAECVDHEVWGYCASELYQGEPVNRLVRMRPISSDPYADEDA